MNVTGHVGVHRPQLKDIIVEYCWCCGGVFDNMFSMVMTRSVGMPARHPGSFGRLPFHAIVPEAQLGSTHSIYIQFMQLKLVKSTVNSTGTNAAAAAASDYDGDEHL